MIAVPVPNTTAPLDLDFRSVVVLRPWRVGLKPGELQLIGLTESLLGVSVTYFEAFSRIALTSFSSEAERQVCSGWIEIMFLSTGNSYLSLNFMAVPARQAAAKLH